MICPECKRIVSPFDKECQHCGTPLETNPVKDYEKKADQITKDAEARAEDIKEQIKRGFREPIPSVESLKNAVADQNDSYISKQNESDVADAKIRERAREEGGWEKFESIQDIKGKNDTPRFKVKITFPRLNLHGINVLNWSLINAGIPLIERLEILNESTHKLENIIVRIKLASGFSDDFWEKTIAVLEPRKQEQFEKINIPILKERLRAVKEQEQSTLNVEILDQGCVVYADSFEIQIQPYNQWWYDPGQPLIANTVAGFISPNSKAVMEVINNATEYLQKLRGISSFPGYQGGPKDVLGMVNAIYLSFQWGLRINYINPPSTFEYPGQKIFLPDEILESKRGTCLDLALLYAACIERIGLFPLLFIVSGHAFLGVWLLPNYYDEFPGLHDVIEDPSRIYDPYKSAVKDKKILPLNSTTFTSGGDFSCCIRDGEDYLIRKQLLAVIDVKRIRPLVKPMQVSDR